MKITREMVDTAVAGEEALIADREWITIAEIYELFDFEEEAMESIRDVALAVGVNALEQESADGPRILGMVLLGDEEGALRQKALLYSAMFSRGIGLGIMIGRASVPLGTADLPETKERE